MYLTVSKYVNEGHFRATQVLILLKKHVEGVENLLFQDVPLVSPFLFIAFAALGKWFIRLLNLQGSAHDERPRDSSDFSIEVLGDSGLRPLLIFVLEHTCSLLIGLQYPLE